MNSFQSIHVILISIVAIVSPCASFSVLTGIALTEVHVDFLHSILEQVRGYIKSWIRSNRVSACGGKMESSSQCISPQLKADCSMFMHVLTVCPPPHTHLMGGGSDKDNLFLENDALLLGLQRWHTEIVLKLKRRDRWERACELCFYKW